MVNYITATMHVLGATPLSWIVVDEAIYNGEGQAFNSNPWSLIDDYVCKAFKAAHNADVSAALFLNDYGIAAPIGFEQAKAYKAFQVIADLQQRGCGISGVGLETHVDMSIDNDEYSAIRSNMNRYGDLNLRVMFSGVDVRCNKFGNPALCTFTADPWPAESLKAQGRVYSRLLNLCLYAQHCDAFITWGFSDWSQEYGGKQNPLPFDKDFRPKEAYYEMCFLLQYFTPSTSSKNELNE